MFAAAQLTGPFGEVISTTGQVEFLIQFSERANGSKVMLSGKNKQTVLCVDEEELFHTVCVYITTKTDKKNQTYWT